MSTASMTRFPLCSKLHSVGDAEEESSLLARQLVTHSYAETLGDFHLGPSQGSIAIAR